ncbi:unnamed protein product [Caenorhabditis brenneri]
MSKLFITPSILRQLMHAYFPPELLQGMNLENSGLIGDQELYDDGRKILEGILRTENKRLKLYGSAQSIAVDLFLFRAFAASQEYFEMDWKENYGFRTPTYITDPDRRHATVPQFKFKQDIYAQLQATIYEALRGVNPMPYAVCSLFLKLKSKQVSETFELVPYVGFSLAEDVDDEMKPIRAAIARGLPAEFLFRRHQIDSFEKCYERFRKLFRGFSVADYEYELKSTLREYYAMNKPIVEPKRYAEMYYMCKMLIAALRKLIDKLPAQFKPFDEKTNPPTIPVVRVFSEGEFAVDDDDEDKERKRNKNKWLKVVGTADKFVMRSEFEWALKKRNLPPIEEDAFPNDKYMKTIPYKERWEREYKTKIQFIDDDIMPVRAKARPIPMPHGGYCVLALHGFKEIFHRMVWGRKVFQKLDYEEIRPFLQQLAAIFLKYFNAEIAKKGHENGEKEDKRCHIFIKLSTLAEIESQIDVLCKPMEGRRAKECSTDNQDLVGRDYIQFEADHLNFKRVFPQAQEAIDNALDIEGEIRIAKQEAYEIIEGIQMGTFCRMFPELPDFVKTQEEPIVKPDDEEHTIIRTVPFRT